MAGVFLLTICLVWTFWLLATIQMGEFSAFRRPLLIALPIGYGLVLRFVGEFLAVRALGILCLLAAEPLLDAAFLRYEPSRLLVTVLAYLLILAGLFWVAIPYLLRDQINWSTRSVFRWRFLHAHRADLRLRDSDVRLHAVLRTAGAVLVPPSNVESLSSVG